MTPPHDQSGILYSADLASRPRGMLMLVGFVTASLLGGIGCGTTKSYTATEQLLMSDAVDSTISQIDFTPLSDRRVFLDSTYLKTVRSPLLVDSDYVLSALRQQMVGHGVRLVDKREEADIIAEARLGALGLDGHSVTYGLPASNILASATSVLGGASIPTLPEISLARREAQTGAAKVAVFAYERESLEPYWQSGIARASSNSKDTWVLGVGPFQQGTIYKRTRFAGQILAELGGEQLAQRESARFQDYRDEKLFAAALEPAMNEAEPTDSPQGADLPETQISSATPDDESKLR